jgi:hypothetical protein
VEVHRREGGGVPVCADSGVGRPRGVLDTRGALKRIRGDVLTLLPRAAFAHFAGMRVAMYAVPGLAKCSNAVGHDSLPAARGRRPFNVRDLAVNFRAR